MRRQRENLKTCPFSAINALRVCAANTSDTEIRDVVSLTLFSVHGYKFRDILVPKLALLSSLSEASSISRRFGREARIIYSTFHQKPKVNAGLRIF